MEGSFNICANIPTIFSCSIVPVKGYLCRLPVATSKALATHSSWAGLEYYSKSASFLVSQCCPESRGLTSYFKILWLLSFLIFFFFSCRNERIITFISDPSEHPPSKEFTITFKGVTLLSKQIPFMMTGFCLSIN